jgi:hypothetical protein
MSSFRQAGRQCSYCGKPIAKNLAHCPHCREVVPQVHLAPARPAAAKRSQIRQGFLYMLLALVIHYAVDHSGALNLPFVVTPAITLYLTPILFLGGLGLALYGFVSRVTA